MDQEMMFNLDRKYRQSGEMEEQMRIVEEQIIELSEFKVHLENIESTKENGILASLGKGVFIKSEMKDKKLFVDVGSGTFVRKTTEEAIKTVDDQVSKLREISGELSTNIGGLNQELQEMMKKAEEESKKAEKLKLENLK